MAACSKSKRSTNHDKACSIFSCQQRSTWGIQKRKAKRKLQKVRMTWKKPSGLVSWMLVFKHVGPSCATAEDTQVGGDIVLDMQQATTPRSSRGAQDPRSSHHTQPVRRSLRCAGLLRGPRRARRLRHLKPQIFNFNGALASRTHTHTHTHT